MDFWPGYVNDVELDEWLAKARKRYKQAILVAAMHHPLAPRMDPVHEADYRPILNGRQVLEVLGAHDVLLSLHGHKHVEHVTSIYHRGSTELLRDGWFMPSVGAGSMCDPGHWCQADCGYASFNLIRLRVPTGGPAYYVDTYVQSAGVDREFVAQSEPPRLLRVETKVAYRCNLKQVPLPESYQMGQADLKLLSEMALVRSLGVVTLRTNIPVEDYAAEVCRMIGATRGFIGMTCCVTPGYLQENAEDVVGTLRAFVRASRDRTVRRIMVLSHAAYLAVAEQKIAMQWFWSNAQEGSRIAFLCTRSDWLNQIPDHDLRFADTDFVLFSGDRDKEHKGVGNVQSARIVAFLAGDYAGNFDKIGHMIASPPGQAQKQEAARSRTLGQIAAFFDTAQSWPPLRRLLIPCWDAASFQANVESHLVRAERRSEAESRRIWSERDRQAAGMRK